MNVGSVEIVNENRGHDVFSSHCTDHRLISDRLLRIRGRLSRDQAGDLPLTVRPCFWDFDFQDTRERLRGMC